MIRRAIEALEGRLYLLSIEREAKKRRRNAEREIMRKRLDEVTRAIDRDFLSIRTFLSQWK